MNSVNLIGNLATDVEIREIDGNDGEKLHVANFVLAVNRRSKDDGADFIRVTTWNGQAESCSKYLSKGKKVAVDGRLRSSSFEKDGEKRYSLEVVAQRVEFLSPAPANGEQSEAAMAAVASGAEDDIPF